MSKTIIQLLLIALTVNCWGKIEVESTKICDLPAKMIQNKYLRFTIIPSANGRISSLVLRHNKNEMLLNYFEKRKQIDPLLPEMVFGNSGGFKEWLWQKKWKNIPNSNMTITNSNITEKKASFTLFSPKYMSSAIQFIKTYSVQNYALEIEMDMNLKNVGAKNENFSLWINIIPNGNIENDYSIIPVAGNSPLTNKRATLTAKKDELRIFGQKNSTDKFIAAGAVWNARYFKKINTIMLFSVTNLKDIRPGGMFYMWQGRIDGKKVVTQEAILSPLKLVPNREKKYKVKLMIFPGMSMLNALSGNTAIHVENKKREMVFTMNSTSSQPERILKVVFGNNSKKIVVPAMQPGKKKRS